MSICFFFCPSVPGHRSFNSYITARTIHPLIMHPLPPSQSCAMWVKLRHTLFILPWLFWVPGDSSPGACHSDTSDIRSIDTLRHSCTFSSNERRGCIYRRPLNRACRPLFPRVWWDGGDLPNMPWFYPAFHGYGGWDCNGHREANCGTVPPPFRGRESLVVDSTVKYRAVQYSMMRNDGSGT